MIDKDLNFWLQHIESFHPAEIELGLQRIRLVAERLDLLQHPGKVVIVGGTNGKGSCVAMLEALALANGTSVGCYTSPHLMHFNERVRINGNDIDDRSLIEAFETIEAARGELPLTFFEFTTLAALLIFKQHALELLVLEVGLGGRLDAVNIVEPDLSIITTIDIDHIEWLGNSLESIAKEKAGIARAGKKTLVGDAKSLALLVNLPQAADVDFCQVPTANEVQIKLIGDEALNPHRLLAQNLMLAWYAFQELFACGDDLFARALPRLTIRGRLQRIAERYTTIVDVAHNAQAALNLSRQIESLVSQQKFERVIAICGMMADKAISEVLQIMDPQVDQWCFVDLPIKRAISSSNLLAIYQQLNLQTPASAYASVGEACESIENAKQNNPLILVFGSFITVANMIQYVQTKPSI